MELLFILPGLEFSQISLFEKKYGKFLLKKEKKILEQKKESKEIFDFLDGVKLDSDLEILICNGPGRFTSLRSFCLILNTLRSEVGAKIFAIGTADFLAEKFDSDLILLQLNQTEVFVFKNGKAEVLTFENLEKNYKEKTTWSGNLRNKLNLPENFEEVFGEKNEEEFLDKFLDSELETDFVKPFYGK